MTSLSLTKDNNNFLPENCFINKLSTNSQANCSAAFSTRLLKANYTGPMINVRRGSDNATRDFYGNVNGVLGTIINGKGQSLSNWLNGATGFVTIWYDQSGNTGRNLIQDTTSQQPVINSTGTSITYDGSKLLYNTTNTPLTSGLDTYTYICNFTATNFGASRTICEISPYPITNNNRSGLMQYFSSYGFVGNNNDAFIINNNTTTNRKCVMMCNHNSSDYPVYAMTSDTSVLSDGTYISSYSSTASGNGELGYLAFDNNVGTVYTCAVDNYVRTTGAYSGATSTIMSSVSYSGEWLQLQMPVGIILTQYTLTSHPGSSQWGRSPRTFYLGGSNNGSTWDLLDNESNLSWSQSAQTSQTFYINNTRAYNYYRIVCNSVIGTDNGGLHTTNAYWSVGELRFFSSGNVVINDNGTIYSGITSGGPRNLSVVPNAFTVGRNANGIEFFIGDINEVIIFTTTLTTRQSQLYFIPDTITRKNYSSIPKIQLKGIPKDNTPIPSGWRVGFDSQSFSHLTSGNTITSVWWSNNLDFNFSDNSNITPVNSPIYRTANGSNNLNAITQAPYIEFTRASSQHLTCGSRTFNIASNSGFTAVCYVRFTGTLGNFERVFDFGNGQASDNIILYRDGTSSNISFIMFNGGTGYSVVTTNTPIIQNEWAIYTVRYNGSNRFTEIIKNGITMASSTLGAAITNKTLSNTYICFSNWTGEGYTSIDIAGMYMYDRFLTNEQISSISNHLVYSTTRNIPNVIPDYSKIFTVGNVLSRGYLRDSAMFFNGDLNSYIDIQDIPNLPLTYSFWFYCTNVTAGSTLVGLTNFDRAGTNYGIQIDINNGVLNVYAALPTNWTVSTNYSVTVNTWYHMTIVVNLSFQVLIYINGSLYQTLTGTAIPPARSRFIIGASGVANTRGYFGYIYDFRVYDYALRASEISVIQMRSPLQLTYTPQSNYLVNVGNWYNDMTLYKTGTYNVVQSGSNPDVQIQLLTSGTTSCSNTYYNKNSIQNYSSFVCSFELWVSTATADALYFYCGSNSSTTNRGLGDNGSYGVSFQVNSNNNTGVNLYNSSGTRVASAGLNNWINTFQWNYVTISYNRGVVGTWVINMNGSDIITYSDPSNATWLTTAGNFWGIGAWCNTSSMDAFIRRVELNFIPNVANTSSNSALISYPRGPMTANTTVLSDGTYIASASSTGTTFSPFKAFDNVVGNTNNVWYPTNLYNSSTGVYTGSTSTTVSGVAQLGEWLQIQLPRAIFIKSYGLKTFWVDQTYTPSSFLLAGSNDGTTWTLLSETISKMNWLYAHEEFFNVNTNLAYNYYRLVFRQIGNVQAGVKDLAIIDTFRLLAAQNVVKYPIATLTSDNTSIPGNTLGNGDYICRASSVDSGNLASYVFNNSTTGPFWHNLQAYNTGNGNYTGSVTTTVSGTSYSGEWVEVQLPNAIQLTSFNIFPRQDQSLFATRSPRSFVMAGSNDGVIWSAVHIASGINDWTAAEKSFTCNQNNSNKYNYFRLIIQEAGNTSNNGGWVNFQMSLFAANSFVSSRLAYPPANLTANTTSLSGQPYGNGTYIASSGTVTPVGNLFNIFDNNPTTEFRFYDYNINTGVYTGSITTTVSGITQTGSWIQIQLPNAIRLTMCSMTALYAYVPRSFVIAGSNNGTTWVSLYDTTDTSSWIQGTSVQNIQVNAKVKYNYYRFIVRRVGVLDNLYGQDICIIYSWVLYDSDVNTPKGLIDGLTCEIFNGYHSESMTFTQTNTYNNILVTLDCRSLTTITNGHIIPNTLSGFSIDLFGYFRANITGTWTFGLTSDYGSYFWIGNNALSGYTAGNSNINNGGTHVMTLVTCTITLLAGVYYPIRILYGGGSGNNDLNFYFTPPGGVPTYNGNEYFFSSTGTNSSYPAESAKVIKDLTGTNTDGVYYINVNGTSTGTYCLMNDMYDGGGWMMLMKATTGNTFQYTSTHWTTTSTLNPTDLTRNNSDAKYNVFNYNNIKDVMAIWPDINPDSYLNVYNKPGGCFYVKDGWVWKVDNWNTYSPIIQQLSTSGQNGLRGAYALYKTNSSYVGATVKLRRYGDNIEQDFFSTLSGNLSTYHNGSGTSLSSWIGAEPKNVLNANNWYSLMTVGAVSAALAGTDPFVQSQLVSGVVNQYGFWSYGSVPISTYSNMFFETQIFWNGSGDFYSMNFGDTTANGGQGISIMFMFWGGYSNNGFSGTGIYLLKNSVALAKSNTSPGGAGANTWFNVQVIYKKTTTNTWQVNINGVSALTYNDSSVVTWAASAGNFFSISANSGGGLQISVWIRQLNLNANFAYVTTWYDQSSNNFHAIQTSSVLQPIITADSSGKYLIDSQNTGTQFLNMGSTTNPIPTGTSNYTLLIRHGSLNTNTGAFIGAGISSSNNQSNVLRGASDGGVGYVNYWLNNDLSFGTNARPAGNSIGITWDGTTRRGYVVTNGGSTMTTVTNSNTNTGVNVATNQQYLFKSNFGENLNGQMYHAYVFNVALGTGDLSVLTNSQNYSPSSSATNSNAESRMTALTGLQLSRLAGSGSIITQPTGLSNPFHYSGFSNTLFSYQTGSYAHAFNGAGATRWGFIFNNENDFASIDSYSGIGAVNGRSAGDQTNGVGGSVYGINRSARFEMYGR